MEILLIAACAWLAYTGGAQSEQAKLGLSPAQRDQMRERTRHEKAVQKIADKHGEATVPAVGTFSPWKDAPSTKSADSALGTFGSGYRSHRPSRPPLGHRAGTWAGRSVTWAHDTGRDAIRSYRNRRKAAGHDDPAPVLVPLPPTVPPMVPPIPAKPPVVADDGDKAEEPAADPVEAAKAGEPEAPKDPATDITQPEPAAAEDEPATDRPPETAPQPTPQSADTPQGVGRMAAEVTYESVADESDELSLMCEDDVRVYDRIRTRAEREIGRGDDLVVKMQAAGFGDKVIGWVARCKEQYQVILAQVDNLQTNTVAQGEQVVKAKALLEAGQGVYADIAKDMESVAVRDAYVSDAVDAEDTNPESEVYETKAAA